MGDFILSLPFLCRVHPRSRFDLTPFLANLPCPVLCVTGESSPFLSELRHLQSHVPSHLLSCAQVSTTSTCHFTLQRSSH